MSPSTTQTALANVLFGNCSIWPAVHLNQAVCFLLRGSAACHTSLTFRSITFAWFLAPPHCCALVRSPIRLWGFDYWVRRTMENRVKQKRKEKQQKRQRKTLTQRPRPKQRHNQRQRQRQWRRQRRKETARLCCAQRTVQFIGVLQQMITLMVAMDGRRNDDAVLTLQLFRCDQRSSLLVRQSQKKTRITHGTPAKPWASRSSSIVHSSTALFVTPLSMAPMLVWRPRFAQSSKTIWQPQFVWTRKMTKQAPEVRMSSASLGVP